MGFNFNAAEVFKIAIAIEDNGKKFYDKAVGIVSDPEVKALFQDLGSQEVDHKARFEAMKAAAPAPTSAVWDPDNELDQYIKITADQHVFIAKTIDSLMAEVKDVKSALKLAMEFEKDSVIFFLTLEDATDGQKDKDAIRALVKEEQEHLKRLSMIYRRVVK